MKALKHLNKYFVKYRFKLIIGMLFVLASNLFSAFPAKLVSKAIDMVVAGLDGLKNTQQLGQRQQAMNEIGINILLFAALVIAFALIRGLFMYLMRQNIIVVSRLIEYDLKNEIFDHYQKLPVSFYRKNNTGDMMARIGEDVGRVRMYIGPALMYFTNLIATFIIVIPIMFNVHAKLALIVLLPLPVLSYAIFYVNNIINKKSDEIQQQLSKLTGFAQETFGGIRVIKAFGAEKFFRHEFETEAEQYKLKNLSLAKVDSLFFPLMVFLTGMSTLITVFLGGMYVINDEITIGNIAEFVIYVNLLTWPVTALGWTSSLVQRAAASQQRINEFLHTEPEIVNVNASTFSFQNEIVFKQVGFKYPGKDNYALKNINITIKRGETLAVLGSTGSGKSTLVQLLLRMIEPEEGRIIIDGVDLNEVNLHAFKNKIGYAPQDVFLFSDTIANNITFGLDHEIKEKEKLMKEAAIRADLHQNVLGFKDAYETIVGERGITLSGGQKQRVSIARALIRNPELLILDDTLSAVDTKTEANILKHLKETIANKTALIISHRVSSVKDADYIVLLDNGEIAEEGTPEVLLEAGGRYSAMYQRQIAEEI